MGLVRRPLLSTPVGRPSEMELNFIVLSVAATARWLTKESHTRFPQKATVEGGLWTKETILHQIKDAKPHDDQNMPLRSNKLESKWLSATM